MQENSERRKWGREGIKKGVWLMVLNAAKCQVRKLKVCLGLMIWMTWKQDGGRNQTEVTSKWVEREGSIKDAKIFLEVCDLVCLRRKVKLLWAQTPVNWHHWVQLLQKALLYILHDSPNLGLLHRNDSSLSTLNIVILPYWECLYLWFVYLLYMDNPACLQESNQPMVKCIPRSFFPNKVLFWGSGN